MAKDCGPGDSRTIRPKCDGHQRPAVRRVTARDEATVHTNAMVNQWTVEAGMLICTFMRLTTASIVVAIALLLAIPFFLALSLPFIGR